MWLCFNDAFVSVVQDKRDSSQFAVRARNKQHLINLFPKRSGNIIETDDSDYRYRLYLRRDQVALLVADRLGKIDYTNFKDSVKDDRLHNLYADFWTLHWKYQEKLLRMLQWGKK